jgi:hypothetical protein
MFYAYDKRKASGVGGFGLNSYITGRKSTGNPGEEDLHLLLLPSAVPPKPTGSVVVKLDAFYTSAL